MEITKILKKTGYSSIITSILLGILGFVMFVYSEATLKVITIALGIITIVTGIFKIISYIKEKGNNDFWNYDIIYGVINLIIGIILLTHPNILEGIIGIVFGIWIIYSGLMRFALALKLKTYDKKSWIPTLILSIVILVLGIYITLSPNVVVATLGMIVLIYSIVDLIEGITFIVNVKRFENLDD